MIFVPLLHYFAEKNNFSGNEGGMRYRLMPGKRTVKDASGAETEEKIITVDIWPDPWTIEFTDPALRSQAVFPFTDEGREAAAKYLSDAAANEPERWANRPSILDCEPWTPPAQPDDAKGGTE